MTIAVNYNSLITEIAAEFNRNDAVFLTQCPWFISFAEQMLFVDFSHLGNEDYLVGNFVPMNGVINKPALWGDTLTFTYKDPLGKLVILERVAYEYCRKYINDPATQNTLYQPTYYTDYGYNRWLIVPTPQFDFQYEIAYLQKIIPLSLSQQTNWNTTYAYDLLFACCCYWAALYLQNDTLIALWERIYKERLDQYNKYNKGRKADRLSDVLKD